MNRGEGKNLNQPWASIISSGLLTAMLVLVLALFSPARAADDEANNSLDQSLTGIKFGILGFLEYSAGQPPLGGDTVMYYNQFTLTRGYFTVTKAITPQLGVRVTMDLAQEAEGARMGELETRKLGGVEVHSLKRRGAGRPMSSPAEKGCCNKKE